MAPVSRAKRSTNGNSQATNGKHHPPEPTKENPAPGAGPFGLAVFLVSLGVLFIGSIVAYLAVRTGAGPAFDAARPPLPQSLRLSTALILVGSVSIQSGVHFARTNRGVRLRAALLVTLALGIAFLVSQALSWIELTRSQTTVTSDLYGWLFYFLTGLHALHVVGGLVPLGIVTVNAFYGRYSPLRQGGIRHVAVYWHFLGVIWISLYAMLLWA
jgi:cytochrome c oxidase subunit 3